MVVVVGHPHLGLLRARCALDGRDLDEVRDVGRGLPDRIVQAAVDVGRVARAPDDHRRARSRRRREAAASHRTPALGAGGRRAGPRFAERERTGHVPFGLGRNDAGRRRGRDALGPWGGCRRGHTCRRRHAGRRSRVGRQVPGERRTQLVLDVEQVAEVAVDAGAERGRAGSDIHEAGRDPQPFSHPLKCSVDEPGDTAPAVGIERAAVEPAVSVSVSVSVSVPRGQGIGGVDRAVPDHAEPRVPQIGCDGFGEAGADPVVGRLPAHVRERHHDDRTGRLRRRHGRSEEARAGQGNRDRAQTYSRRGMRDRAHARSGSASWTPLDVGHCCA